MKFLPPPKMRGKEDIAPQVNVFSYVAAWQHMSTSTPDHVIGIYVSIAFYNFSFVMS